MPKNQFKELHLPSMKRIYFSLNILIEPSWSRMNKKQMCTWVTATTIIKPPEQDHPNKKRPSPWRPPQSMSEPHKWEDHRNYCKENWHSGHQSRNTDFGLLGQKFQWYSTNSITLSQWSLSDLEASHMTAFQLSLYRRLEGTCFEWEQGICFPDKVRTFRSNLWCSL